MKNILPVKGEVYYIEHFFEEEQAKHLFSQILKITNWQQRTVRIFGKEIPQPRLTAFYGDPKVNYTYSGLQLSSEMWTPVLLQIKKKVENLTQTTFNSALLNLYRNGHDSMDWHRDNEKELGPEPVIASLSFGAARLFHLREFADKKKKIVLQLKPGSLLLMKGKTQHCWEHALPKTKKETGQRVNITFRKLC